jgi:hypothetical protein
VSVVDTTAPEITLLGSDPVTIEVHSAYTDDGATASDNYDGDLTSSIVTYNPVNTELLGTYTLTYDVTDSNGNAADQVTRTVNVVDTTAPELGSMGDIIREADSASGAAVEFETPSATDNYDPSPSVDCVPASGSTFPIGTTTVTCTATDLSDNTASGSFNVMVVDTTAPVLAVPSDMTKEATSSAGAIAEFNSSANDTIDGPIDPICTPASGSTFPLGTTTVACSVTDSHNNTASGSFTVTVQDTTAPALTVPSDKSVSTKSKTGAKVTYVANATDIVDGPLAVICTPSSGSTFKVGATIVSCIATDSHNNTATATFKVKVSYKSSGSGGGGGGTPYVPPSPPSTIEPEAEPEPELPVQEPEPVIQSPGTKTPQTGTSGQNPLPTIPEPNADVPQAAALFGLDLGNLWLLCPIALLLGLILFAILTRKKCKSCKEKNWLWAKKCKKCGTAFGSK